MSQCYSYIDETSEQTNQRKEQSTIHPFSKPASNLLANPPNSQPTNQPKKEQTGKQPLPTARCMSRMHVQKLMDKSWS